MIRSPFVRILSSSKFEFLICQKKLYLKPFFYLDSKMINRRLSTEIADSFKHLKIVEHKPFVYNVQMNREKKMNALNKQLWW